MFEHILCTSNVKRIDAQSLLNSKQHGLRKRLSCVTQVIEFAYDVAEATNNRETVDCVLLGFGKVFDVVPNKLFITRYRILILILKLSSGFRNIYAKNASTL